MKSIRVIGAASLFLVSGSIVAVYAQRDQGDKQGNSEKQDRGRPERAQQPRQPQEQKQAPPQRAQQPRQPQQQKQESPQRAQQPQQRQQQKQAQPQRAQQPQQQPQQRQQQKPAQPQRAQRNYQPPVQRSQQQARTWQQQKGWVQKGGWQGHDSWQGNRAQHWASDHRTWAQRGGYGGYYIPPDRYSLYFGRQHFFRLHARPVMYLGYPRFDYGGFSFLLVDPWPEYWSDNWYGADDLYIDYDDGYYLYDRKDAQVRLAITIVL